MGDLMMNGQTVQFPPRDVDGANIHLGDKVYGVNDSYNFHNEKEFIVGAFRLQITKGELLWVVCAYDDADFYFEAFDYECKVLETPFKL